MAIYNDEILDNENYPDKYPVEVMVAHITRDIFNLSIRDTTGKIFNEEVDKETLRHMIEVIDNAIP